MEVKANTMRSFAAGIILATSILGVVYFSGPNETKGQNDAPDQKEVKTVEKLSTSEMKSQLTAEGYVIHTKAEWDKQVAAVKTAEKKLKEANKKIEENNSQPQTEVPAEKVEYRMILSVSQGMTGSDVGQALVQGKIIGNALEFSNLVESKGLANALRPGVYEIKSGMTMDEIISTIFKQ